jgi:hypothetical protein
MSREFRAAPPGIRFRIPSKSGTAKMPKYGTGGQPAGSRPTP